MKQLRPFGIWIVSLLVFSSLMTACSSGSPAAEVSTSVTSTAQEHFNQGVASYDSGDLKQAIADFTQALDLNLDFAEAYNNRGLAYKDSGDLEQAIADYR